MKLIIVAILIIILTAVIVQDYLMFQEKSISENKLRRLLIKAEALEKDRAEIKSGIEYFSRPENIEKELRAKFNYKKPEEKMIIVVP